MIQWHSHGRGCPAVLLESQHWLGFSEWQHWWMEALGGSPWYGTSLAGLFSGECRSEGLEFPKKAPVRQQLREINGGQGEQDIWGLGVQWTPDRCVVQTRVSPW